MANYTYPVATPEGALTTEQIHMLLSNPTLVARRIAELSRMGFIGDFLLSGRFKAVGGGIFYENGEEIFAADAPESVAPNGAYPKMVMTEGELIAAKTDKIGLGTVITDEKISQLGMTHVRKALLRLSNSVIRTVDSRAIAVILSKVTSTFASPSQWTTGGKMVESLTSIQATRGFGGTGLDLNTVVLKPAQYAKVLGTLMDDKVLPRETGNAAITGNLPVDVFGFTWTTSPFWTSDDPYLIDRDQLGGMADEDLMSPDYVRVAGSNVETHTDRNKRDGYDVRARRIVVPVVTEPNAGVKLTNTGL